MSRVHTINLGNAWEAEPGHAGQAPAWVRRFGRPAGLACADIVWLVIDAPAEGAVVVNGAALPSATAGVAYRANVTAMLRDRNLLVLVPRQAVATALPPPRRGSLPAAVGSVRLEIAPGVADDAGPTASGRRG